MAAAEITFNLNLQKMMMMIMSAVPVITAKTMEKKAYVGLCRST